MSRLFLYSSLIFDMILPRFHPTSKLQITLPTIIFPVLLRLNLSSTSSKRIPILFDTRLPLSLPYCHIQIPSGLIAVHVGHDPNTPNHTSHVPAIVVTQLHSRESLTNFRWSSKQLEAGLRDFHLLFLGDWLVCERVGYDLERFIV
uniref:(northern house mosquito) hypothetical protein n=1 Tax=Culex pipiens TaxID=7175 RepID=A0A8D8CH33_CULPI